MPPLPTAAPAVAILQAGLFRLPSPHPKAHAIAFPAATGSATPPMLLMSEDVGR
jgi:hypothetical protein